ncbi:MAG: ABC transporter permease [Actinomycetota bacterium]|nr:ABC transporter permease [Actinomycetota bacterium]
MADGQIESITGEAPVTAAPPTAVPPSPSPAPPLPRTRTRYARLESVARQLGAGLLTLLVISVVTFAATNVKSPIDVARNALGRETSEAQLQAYVKEHGLDEPIYVRYGNWLGDFVRGDWGVSAVTNRNVREDVVPRLEKTLLLSFASLLVALPISVALGVYMARRAGSWNDLSLLIGTVVFAAMPEFVVGIGLLMLFAVTLGWLPVDSTALSFGTMGEKVEAYVLPALTLVLAMVPYIVRIARGAAREALAAPFTQAALLRGLPRRTVIWDHAMRNAAVPLVNAVAINLVYLLSGVIVVENVFAFPGIGQALVQAIAQGDVITVQAIALVMGAMFIAISLLADLLVVYFNPRLKAATA